MHLWSLPEQRGQEPLLSGKEAPVGDAAPEPRPLGAGSRGRGRPPLPAPESLCLVTPHLTLESPGRPIQAPRV